ncbi:MAG: RNA polymerase sigma factor [Candidatus Sulfotelmatobacter sp.]
MGTVSQLAAGSFERLAMPHLERLYNFACWLTHDRQEAEDLVQETYAKALKGFSSFQPGTNFRAWIYKILRNTFLTSRTGLKATATVPLDLEGAEEMLPAVKETPESILLQRSDGQLVQQVLEQLPVAYREVLLLCEVEEMSYQEISATHEAEAEGVELTPSVRWALASLSLSMLMPSLDLFVITARQDSSRECSVSWDDYGKSGAGPTICSPTSTIELINRIGVRCR